MLGPPHPQPPYCILLIPNQIGLTYWMVKIFQKYLKPPVTSGFEDLKENCFLIFYAIQRLKYSKVYTLIAKFHSYHHATI